MSDLDDVTIQDDYFAQASVEHIIQRSLIKRYHKLTHGSSSLEDVVYKVNKTAVATSRPRTSPALTHFVADQKQDRRHMILLRTKLQCFLLPVVAHIISVSPEWRYRSISKSGCVDWRNCYTQLFCITPFLLYLNHMFCRTSEWESQSSNHYYYSGYAS